MASPIYVTQGKLVTDVSLIPYIRRQKIMFDADNLRPYRVASLFFDDITVNNLTQVPNLVKVNARKKLGLSTTQSYTAVTTDIAWQGSSFPQVNYDPFSSNVLTGFYGIVESYNSTTKILTLSDLAGNFDEDAPIYISDSTGATLKVTATILSEVSQNNASIFSQDDEVYVQRTNAYMTVVGTSGENLLYLNENYIYCNVISTTTALSSATYEDDDLVMQTSDGTNTYSKLSFLGRVKLFKPQASANTLSIETIFGTIKTNSSTANTLTTLYNKTKPASPSIKVLNTKVNDYTNSDYIVSVSTGKKLQVKYRKHFSGVIANTTLSFSGLGTNDGKVIQLAASPPSNVVGRHLKLTSGRGVGQNKRIIAVSQNAVMVNSAFHGMNVSSETHYSIGNHVVDENGGLCGIFNLPEEPNFKFKTGERIFTITDTDKVDNPSYTMKAAATFTASGLLNINQRIVSTPINRPLPEYSADNPTYPSNPTQGGGSSSSPILGTTFDSVPRIGFVNGLSQTFFTPKAASNKIDRGIFVSSIDLFFKFKPSLAKGSMQLPVCIRIAEVVNGYPTKRYVAYCKVPANQVRVARGTSAQTVAINRRPSVDDPDTVTKFRFKDPVYLEPNTEYAITIGSESPEYELWVAELGQEVLGANPPRRISEQPYAGSLFKSQNSSTWTPYQNQDLMFVINKAVFNGSGGSTLFRLSKPPTFDLDISKLLVHTNDLAFTNAVVDYSIKSYRKNKSTSVPTQEAIYTDIKAHKFLRYGELTDQDATYTNTRYINLGDINSIILKADVVTADTDISPIINRESISVSVSGYKINDAGISNSIINIVEPGSGYKREQNGNLVGSTSTTMNTAASTYRTTYHGGNTNVAMYSLTFTSPSGSGATGFAVANTDGTNRIESIVMVTEGSGYYDTPTLAITAPIDTTPQQEAYAYALGETGTDGGNVLARYQTRQISLLEGFEGGDLIVFLDAIRPYGTDIQVYYKVLGVDDVERFSEKTWVRMERRLNVYSKDSNTIKEYEYRPSLLENKLTYTLNGTQYPIGGVFKSFAVKICLTSTDSAVVPYIRNLRISAVPAG